MRRWSACCIGGLRRGRPAHQPVELLFSPRPPSVAAQHMPAVRRPCRCLPHTVHATQQHPTPQNSKFSADMCGGSGAMSLYSLEVRVCMCVCVCVAKLLGWGAGVTVGINTGNGPCLRVLFVQDWKRVPHPNSPHDVIAPAGAVPRGSAARQRLHAPAYGQLSGLATRPSPSAGQWYTWLKWAAACGAATAQDPFT